MDNSLVVQLGMDLSKMESGLHHGVDLLEGFQEQVKEIGSSIVAAFAIEKVADFAFEISELAGKAANVKSAFDQLPKSNLLMEQLRETTHETVGDLELMGFAIHAQNLNIPLKDLGELLEFAHIRALETNQDFNTLANTLITAIGRGGAGAKRAMAELQISTEDYNKALKETGNTTDAVMKLAKEAIESNKGSMDETLHAIEENSAAWENFKIKLGEVLNSSHLLAAGLETLNSSLKVIGSENLSFWEKISAFATGPGGMMKALLDDNYDTQRKISKESHDQLAAFNELYQKTLPHAEAVKNIAFYENEIKELEEKKKEAIGQELTDIERTLEIEKQKLEVLQLQYQLQRDQVNTSTLGKMAGFDNFTTPQLANVNILPPAENVDKANKAIQNSINLLNKLNNLSRGYVASIDEIFNEKKIRQFADAIHNGMASVITDLAAGLGELASGAANSDQIWATLLGGVGTMAIQLGQLAIGVGIGIEAIHTALESLDGPVAIAAGVALVALGSAVRGAASNIGKGGSGGSSHASSMAAKSYSSPQSQPQQIYGNVVLRGQDLWVALSSFQTNSNYTRVG